MLTETEIYLRLKAWLREHTWVILGGEPAGGTNDIPIIEVKDPQHKMRGSKGSRKVDLVAFKEGHLLLIELKRSYSHSDIKKLNEIVSEGKWRTAFVHALRQKRVFEAQGIAFAHEEEYSTSTSKYIKTVSFNYTGEVGPEDFVTFLVSTDGVKVMTGAKLSPEALRLLA